MLRATPPSLTAVVPGLMIIALGGLLGCSSSPAKSMPTPTPRGEQPPSVTSPDHLAGLGDSLMRRLPDFSYAGYAAGERPLPTPAGPLFDVTHYGAVPDGSAPSDRGIQAAIDACEEAGGGVVWFPPGTYRVNPAGTKATAPRLRIRRSNVILRGAGSGPGGSVLYAEEEILPEDPGKMYSGRPMLHIKPHDRAPALTQAIVAGAVPLNARRIPVRPGHGLRAGDRIALVQSIPGTETAALQGRISPRTWHPEWKRGLHFKELHEIAEVEPQAIVLAACLLTPIADDETWTIEPQDFLREIGIEHLTFRGNWRETFVHHGDWRHDSGWRGLVMAQVEHGWIRDCSFEDMNWGVQVLSCRQITTEHLVTRGTRGHFGINTTRSTNVLHLHLRDEAGHHHGPSVQNGSAGVVHHHARWSADGGFDSHGGNAYATLFEQGQGGLNPAACGGAFENFPHHLHGFVLWNHHHTGPQGKMMDFWAEDMRRGGHAKSFLDVAVVGLTGPQPDLRDVTHAISAGSAVEPGSLWLTQVQARLGTLPAHLTNPPQP